MKEDPTSQISFQDGQTDVDGGEAGTENEGEDLQSGYNNDTPETG